MAKAVHFSHSALAQATSGRRLPSESVTAAFAVACGADPDVWIGALKRAQDAIASETDTAPSPSAPPAALPSAASGLVRRRTALMGAAGALGLGLLLGAFIGSASNNRPTALPPSTSAAQATAIPTAEPTLDGADPVQAGCTADARLTDKVPIILDGAQVGALEIKYSPKCAAGWARAYLYPGQPTMMAQVAIRAGDGRAASFGHLLVKQTPVYTNVIVPGAGGCLEAQAVVSEAGRAPVSASTTCESP